MQALAVKRDQTTPRRRPVPNGPRSLFKRASPQKVLDFSLGLSGHLDFRPEKNRHSEKSWVLEWEKLPPQNCIFSGILGRPLFV
jgi:hypothetical protein